MQQTVHRFSLWPILGTFCIMLCVTGAAFYQIYAQRMAEERVMGLQLANLASQAMGLWLDDQVSLVRTMAQTPAVRDACAHPGIASLRDAATEQLRAFHAHHLSYTLMALISYQIPPEGITIRNDQDKDIHVRMGHSVGDSRGNVSVGVGGMDFSYITAIYNGAVGYIGEAKVNSVPGLPPVFVLAAPVHKASGELLGTLIASVTLDDFSFNFSQGSNLRGKAHMEIVDQRGRFVAHDEADRVLNPQKAPPPSLLQALKQGADHFSIVDERGHSQIYSASAVAPDTPSADRWWVLFRRDLHNVLAELHAPLISLGLLFLLLFVLVAYLMRTMGRNMRQIVSASALQAELTMHHTVKQTLQKERTTLRSILDNIQGIVFLRDKQDRYVVVNSQFTTILGLTQAFVEGKTDGALLPPELAAFCRITDDAAKARRGPYYFEQSLPMPDGTRRDYLFSKEVLHGEEGTFDGMLCVGIDVTLLKQTQHELSEAKARAEEASRAKSVFLSTMSHEIRTPMNAIVGFAHLFGRTPLNDTQKEYLKKIHIASTSLLSIINNVLDLSKIESGKLELERVPFRLDVLLQAVVSMAEHAAQPKGILFTLEVDPSTPLYFMGDPTRVQQVLLNMVNNAVKFTDAGGVSLHVSPADALVPPQPAAMEKLDTPPTLSTDASEDTAQPHAAPTTASGPARVPVRFCINDTGIGMSEEQQKRIFEPFTQADTSTTRKYGGTGLGLSICRELVDLMGGGITLHSRSGQGSTFCIVLPLEEISLMDEDTPQNPAGTEATAPDAANAAPPPFAGFTVLLAEDNIINQEIARALLEDLGLTVDMAEDGQQTLDMVRLRRYDLIFMDIQMPHMDGLESTLRMRAMGAVALEAQLADAWLSSVPIIAMTANAMHEDKLNCLAAGMNAHLGKPLDPKVLQETLRHWLGG